MQIRELVLTNFCGVSGSKTYHPQNINALLGANGTGKTTLLNGIRYALTGTEPDGPILHEGTEACTVSITLTDPVTGEDMVFTRIKHLDKPSKFKIGDMTTTLKAMSEKLETIVGIPLDKVSITSSSELVAAMKPQEFSKFILDYIPKKSTLADIITLVPDTTMEMIEVMEKYLPHENVDMMALDTFEKFCRTTRSDLKALLSKKTALYATMPQENPKYDAVTLKKRLQEISNYAGAKALYLQKLSHYKTACDTKKRYETSILQLKERIAAIKAERPNPMTLSSLQEAAEEYKKSIQNQRVAIAGVTSAIGQLRITLEALEKPICPISPLISCHQDKTVAKEEVSESIKSSEEGLTALKEELRKAEKKLEAVEAEMVEYNFNANAYNNKLSLMKQLKVLEDAIPEVPAMPEPIEEMDVVAEEKEVKAKLTLQEKFLEGQTLASQIAMLHTELAMYEALSKAFAEKGPVKTGLLSSYLKIFEDICNERSTKFRPGITFEFQGEDGVIVLMSNGKTDAKGRVQKLPYKALSGGEKAYMLFILMDMLNQLTGTRLLFLDEMNLMDQNVLGSLLDIILDCKGEYDHIFLSSVNHSDIEDVFVAKGLI